MDKLHFSDQTLSGSIHSRLPVLGVALRLELHGCIAIGSRDLVFELLPSSRCMYVCMPRNRYDQSQSLPMFLATIMSIEYYRWRFNRCMNSAEGLRTTVHALVLYSAFLAENSIGK